MLYLAKLLSKLTGTLLLLALLTSCEKQESTTEFIGKIVDLDTSQPVADTKVELVVADGLAPGGSFVAPEVMNGSANSKGAYKFVKTYRQGQTVYRVTPEKSGYVEVNNALGKVLKPNERNVQDIGVAKGSYFKLNINNSVSTPGKDLKVILSHPLNVSASPIPGMMYNAEIINYNAANTAAELIRGFYFKRTPFVLLDWEVTADGSTEKFSLTIPLAEHDTVHFEIVY